jgi:prohibitin 2
MVEISLRVLYKPDAQQLPFIYRRLGQGLFLFFPFLIFFILDFDERVLPSIVNEVSKAVVAQFNASELLTHRDDVSRLIREMLSHRARDFQILL